VPASILSVPKLPILRVGRLSDHLRACLV
jgi:hypothetical protein